VLRSDITQITAHYIEMLSMVVKDFWQHKFPLLLRIARNPSLR